MCGSLENHTSFKNCFFIKVPIHFNFRFRNIRTQPHQRIWWNCNEIYVMGCLPNPRMLHHLQHTLHWAQKPVRLSPQHFGWMHLRLRLHQHDSSIVHKLQAKKRGAHAQQSPLLPVLKHHHRRPLQFRDHHAYHAPYQLLPRWHHLCCLSLLAIHLRRWPNKRHVCDWEAWACAQAGEREGRGKGKSQGIAQESGGRKQKESSSCGSGRCGWHGEQRI